MDRGNLDWDEARFREELVECPEYAWPTLIFLLLAVLTMPSMAWFAVNEAVPTWIAVAVNSYCVYMLFMVMHDSAHRSVSTHRWINEGAGQISTAIVIPFSVLASWRFAHLRHHAHTNETDGSDPDCWASSGPSWQLPFRWATLDLAYLVYFFPKLTELKREELVEWGVGIAAASSIFAVAYLQGFFIELLLYWVLPTRISVFWVAFIFDYYPHHHEILQREKPFEASIVRAGYSRLGSLITMNQNYHTMHHIYPRVPFYKIKTAWFAKLGYHLTQNPAISYWSGKRVSAEDYRTRFLMSDRD